MDDKAPHIEYRMEVLKVYEEDHAPGVDCVDHFEGKVHGKDEADAITTFFRSRGYKVKLVRMTHKYLLDDPFPNDPPAPEPDAGSEERA